MDCKKKSPGATGGRPRGFGAASALLRCAGALPKKATEARPNQLQVELTANSDHALSGQSDRKTCQKPRSRGQSKQHRDEGLQRLQDQQGAPAQQQSQVEFKKPSAVPPPRVVDFLEHCLGGPAALLEAEIEAAAEADGNAAAEMTPDADQVVSKQEPIIQDDSSESFDEGPDLEDMFDFDPFTLATMISKGASERELADHLEESYAGALERRLSVNGATEELLASTEAETAEATGPSEAADVPKLQMGKLSPLMTPEQNTPLMTPKGSRPSGKLEDCLAGSAKKLREDCARVQDRARRSLAVQSRPSAMQRGSVVSRAVEAFGRRSLAQLEGASAEDREMLEGAIQSAARRASNRHRRSVTKAVEVLEEVADADGVPLETWSEEMIDSKVEIVQKAMDEAYRRHRRSITAAVKDIVTATPAVESAPAAKKADEPPLSLAGRSQAILAKRAAAEALTTSAEERIQRAVASAYERRDWLSSFHQRASQQEPECYGGGCSFQQDEFSGWCAEPGSFLQEQSTTWVSQANGFDLQQTMYGQDQSWLHGQCAGAHSYQQDSAWSQGQGDAVYGHHGWSQGQEPAPYGHNFAWSQGRAQTMYGQEHSVYEHYGGLAGQAQQSLYGQHNGASEQTWGGVQDYMNTSKVGCWDATNNRAPWRYGSA